MTTKSFAHGCVICTFLFTCNSLASAQEEQLVAAIQRAKTFVSVTRGDKVLESIPVLTTNNPSRGTGLDGTMLLWLSQGRPVAAMSIYAWEGKIMHESDSLSRTGDFVATSGAGKRWTPKRPGLTFQLLETSSEGALSSDTQRLQKMRALAKQFEVTMLGFNAQNSDREQLRMLTTPVYRYQLKDERTDHRELIDGAVFAFVQGTDPEALLVLELSKRDRELSWEYALVRATAGALEAKLNDKVVFEAAKFPENTNPTLPHFTFSHEVHEVLK